MVLPNRPRSRHEFEIAIICALSREAGAVQATFDDRFEKSGASFGKHPLDQNLYTPGRLGRHNVVLVHLAGAGKVEAAATSAQIRLSYPNIKLALLVGICGATPIDTENEETMLGDIIISNSVIQYDLGKQYPDGFKKKSDIKDTLSRPPRELRAFLSKLDIPENREEMEEQIWEQLKSIQSQNTRRSRLSRYPGVTEDKLFFSSYSHKHRCLSPNSDNCICLKSASDELSICDKAQSQCCDEAGCDQSQVERTRPSAQGPQPQPIIHIGPIISTDTVMKSGIHRDEIARQEKAIAFEMEGSGVWDTYPCIIIKAACDYADSHKNDTWHEYAAAVAACCTKAFLQDWNPSTMECK
jgi:nucleoside phosphorylase